MIKCAVYGCLNNVNTADPAVQYYFFPKHPVIAQQWINACCMWRPEEMDVNTARICSIHFDSNSYTSEYKMVDYLGVYTKVLKYNAVPTLYLPQQTAVTVIKSQLQESLPPNDMKQIILYGTSNNQEPNFDTSYTSNGLVLENLEQSTPSSKYEELRNMSSSVTENVEAKVEKQSENGPVENNGIYKSCITLQQQDVTASSKYELQNLPSDIVENAIAKTEHYSENNSILTNEISKSITTYREYKMMETENDKLRKELSRLQQSIVNLKPKLQERMNLYKKVDAEYNKTLKLHNSLERRSMSVGDQKNLLSKVFSESQIKILSGKKKIYWSNDDMAIGYTIRHMSSKRCYMYLSKNLNIPLPALSSIKRWQTLKKGEYVKEEKMDKDKRNIDSDE